MKIFLSELTASKLLKRYYHEFNGKNSETLFDITCQVDIPVMLTPHSGDIDPSREFGLKDKLLTNLQFFS